MGPVEAFTTAWRKSCAYVRIFQKNIRSKPIVGFDDWANVNNTIAALSPSIVRMQEVNSDGSWDELISKAMQELRELIQRSLTGPAPLRDQIIRHRAFVYSKLCATGKNIDEYYEEVFDEEIYQNEYQYLIGNIPEPAMREQIRAVNNEDLVSYIETLAIYYCNRLLNLADGGKREQLGIDHWSCIRLKELTHILECRGMVDEFYVARSAVVHAFGSFSGVFLWDELDKKSWQDKASKMLMEMYS